MMRNHVEKAMMGQYNSPETLPPMKNVGWSPQSDDVLGLFKNGDHAVVRAYLSDDQPPRVTWEELSHVTGAGWTVEDLVGWIPLPASASQAHKNAVNAAIPVTDRGVYSVLLEACVMAEESDHAGLAGLLRALVDASPFSGCPTGCNGQKARPGQPDCTVCQGSGFIPDGE